MRICFMITCAHTLSPKESVLPHIAPLLTMSSSNNYEQRTMRVCFIITCTHTLSPRESVLPHIAPLLTMSSSNNCWQDPWEFVVYWSADTFLQAPHSFHFFQIIMDSVLYCIYTFQNLCSHIYSLTVYSQLNRISWVCCNLHIHPTKSIFTFIFLGSWKFVVYSSEHTP